MAVVLLSEHNHPFWGRIGTAPRGVMPQGRALGPETRSLRSQHDDQLLLKDQQLYDMFKADA